MFMTYLKISTEFPIEQWGPHCSGCLWTSAETELQHREQSLKGVSSGSRDAQAGVTQSVAEFSIWNSYQWDSRDI